MAIKRYDYDICYNPDVSSYDVEEVLIDDGAMVQYTECKALCDEAIKTITELCKCFNVPLPQATLDRLDV